MKNKVTKYQKQTLPAAAPKKKRKKKDTSLLFPGFGIQEPYPEYSKERSEPS